MIAGTVTVGFLHPGHWQACFGNSLNELMFYDATMFRRIVGNPHHKFGLMANESTATQIVAGRNKLARVVLDEAESEWLFIVDADMGFDPDTVERLISSADKMTRPVVGGLAFALKSDGSGPFGARRYRAVPTLYKMYETDDEVGFVPDFDYPRDRVVKVDATGCACLLVHRSALRKVRDQHGDTWFDPIRLPKGEQGFTEFGEDMSFCLRLAACGIPIHVDPRVKTTHDKGGVFLDEETFDLQQAFKAMVS